MGGAPVSGGFESFGRRFASVAAASRRNELESELARETRVNERERKNGAAFPSLGSTPLARWFRRFAETNLNPSWSAKHESETAVIFQFFGIGE